MTRVVILALIGCAVIVSGAGHAAEGTYPFEGAWVRADRTCSATSTRERIYTSRDVTSSRGRCTIRKIVAGSGAFELFERCERQNEKPSSVRETIRMTGPDTLVLMRRTERLKLSRSLRFSRCPIAAAPSRPVLKPIR